MQVLEWEPGNCKARLRRCMALARNGECDRAAEDLLFLQEHDPSLLVGTTLAQEIERARVVVHEKEKKLYKGMFS